MTKMASLRLALLVALLTFSLDSACSLLEPSSTGSTQVSPDSFTKYWEPISAKNAPALMEVVVLKGAKSGSKFDKLEYSLPNQTVVAADSDTGIVVGWDIGTQSVAFEHELGFVTERALSFFDSGRKLIGATERSFNLDRYGNETEYVKGIAVWDVRTGTLINCVTFPCQGTRTPQNSYPGDGYLGATIDEDGGWIASYFDTVIGISDLNGDQPGLVYAINPPDGAYQWQIGWVAFDSANGRYAIVFREGGIHLSTGIRTVAYDVVAEGVQGRGAIVYDARIDPSGRWLAISRGETIEVFSLENRKRIFTLPITNPAFAFDRSGKLFFVKEGGGFSVYELPDMRTVTEYQAAGLVALTVSQDNRLVLWSDNGGAIHILGSKEK